MDADTNGRIEAEEIKIYLFNMLLWFLIFLLDVLFERRFVALLFFVEVLAFRICPP